MKCIAHGSCDYPAHCAAAQRCCPAADGRQSATRCRIRVLSACVRSWHGSPCKVWAGRDAQILRTAAAPDTKTGCILYIAEKQVMDVSYIIFNAPISMIQGSHGHAAERAGGRELLPRQLPHHLRESSTFLPSLSSPDLRLHCAFLHPVDGRHVQSHLARQADLAQRRSLMRGVSPFVCLCATGSAGVSAGVPA